MYIHEVPHYDAYTNGGPSQHHQQAVAYNNDVHLDYRSLPSVHSPSQPPVTYSSPNPTYIVDPNGYAPVPQVHVQMVPQQMDPAPPPPQPPVIVQPRRITPPPPKKIPREIEPEPNDPRKNELDIKARECPETMTEEERVEWKRLRAAELKRYARNTGHFDISFLYED